MCDMKNIKKYLDLMNVLTLRSSLHTIIIIGLKEFVPFYNIQNILFIFYYTIKYRSII